MARFVVDRCYGHVPRTTSRGDYTASFGILDSYNNYAVAAYARTEAQANKLADELNKWDEQDD